MRCTGKSARYKRARRRRNRIVFLMTVFLVILCFSAAGLYHIQYNNKKEEHLAAEYESSRYNKSLHRGSLYSADLCVATEDVPMDNAPDTNTLKAAALFDVDGRDTEFAYKIHERMYPASLTKLMTALVTFDSGTDLSETVVVSANADSGTFALDEQICGIKEGDQLSLESLLFGLIVYSGNDNAVAIAEHVGGSIDKFAEMMNAKAQEIMATNSHFVNPNGLHNENHYTTAYDMYLIFNECIKNDKFMEIIQADSYEADVKRADGSSTTIKWEPTSYYALGEAELPKSGKIIGGKTGTTLKAGNCLVLLDESDSGKPFISIVMGAETKELLYQDMTALIEGISDSE